MQGMHAFEPKAKASIDLESFVAEDHFLRQIDRVLDLKFVRALTAARYADGQGRPSIDPEVFFRMQLVAYFYGITTDRRLCEDVRYHLAYRWFCRLALEDEVPDHSSLSRIRDRYGENIFEAVFREIVGQCQQKGLVKCECRVMTDATLIAADASLNSLIHNDPQQAQKEAEAQRQRRGTIDGQAQRKLSNQTHRSQTDPDATLAQKQGTPRQLKYKVHQTIDADSRIILDTEVTTGGRHDNQPYLEQLQRVGKKYQITIHEAIADRGYGSAEIIKALQCQGTETYIPLWNRRSGRNSGAAVGLEYEREHDRIRCAAGKYLYPSAGDYGNRTRYSSSPGQCRDCPLASTCAAKNRPNAPHTRFVLRPVDQDVFDEVQHRMNEPEFRQKISERMWKMEGLFAEAKQNHCLARAKYRGRPKVQIQAYLIAIVQNLKRLLFPVYCWLLACRGSYSTTTRLPCHQTNQAHQPTAKPKNHSHFFNRPGGLLNSITPPGIEI
jgi:transposase